MQIYSPVCSVQKTGSPSLWQYQTSNMSFSSKPKKPKDGKFRPSVSVIHQNGSHFNTMTIDLDNSALFVAESAAIKNAKYRITEVLTKHHTQAEIRFSKRLKVA